jgi:filamentous hemagglutinin family protein
MSKVSTSLYWWQCLAILVGSLIALYPDSSVAQITPDATLPNNSQVNEVNKTFNITGGTSAGGNLFHSFQEFSIPTGREAVFNNGADIQNILTRVTGNSISNIDGLIKANGSANLFLMNPNGIVFGENAELNIGGSFFGTSAESMKFSDGSEFSAVNPQQEPLLTVNVPLGLQYGTNARNIQIQGSNLQVNNNQLLALIGGNVSADSATIQAIGGQIELGGLAAPGTILLNTENTGNINNNLSFPAEVARGDILLTNGTQVNVAASGGGSIAINARNLDILGRSAVNAGIAENVGTADTVAGDINVNTNAITLENSSLIQNIVNTGATGNAGKINVVTDSLNLLTGSQLFSSSLAKGNGGNVNVRAQNTVSFDSAGNNTSTSGIISSIGEEGEGRAGDINITSGSFSITNGAQLNSITFGQGDAGNITINASDAVSFDGGNAGASGIISSVTPSGVGKAGDINITAASVSVTNGAQLNALTLGRGDAGNVNINARETVSIDGERRLSTTAAASAILTSVAGNENSGFPDLLPAIGDGGDIRITAQSLSITNGAELNSITKGTGNAGNIYIETRDTIFLDGENSNQGASGILSSVDANLDTTQPPAIGNGGDVNITTKSLSIQRGAGIFTNTQAQGNAGNVNINARDTISFDGINSAGGASGIFSSVDDNLGTEKPPARGNGGDIKITANSLSATNGSGVFATTAGRGDAGNVNINARETISLDGINSNGGSSGVFSDVKLGAVGNGRNIEITANELFVTNDAIVSTTNEGDGAAGNIRVNANSINLEKGTLSSDTVGAEGNINLRTTDSLLLRRDSNITTEARGENVIGGNINIDSGVVTVLENSRISANSADSRGGRVNIDTEGLYGTQTWYPEAFRGFITATGATPDLSGEIEVNTEIDATQALTELPINLVDASNQINTACNPGGSQFDNEFVVTGRGGLPMNPTEILQETNTLSNSWVRLKPQAENAANTVIKPSPPTVSNNHQVTRRNQIVEATGWIVDKDGNIEFVAQANPINPKFRQIPVSCSASK